MALNEWGMTMYPFVPGHEVCGRVAAAGPAVRGLSVGQRVGLGWFSHSCLHCDQCKSGDHNLCGEAEQTIVGRHGGFANRVRANWEWVTPLSEEVDPISAGPLFCGGITVFNPLLQSNVLPIHHMGVVGIGGLGHMALQFLRAWGCEVTAFSTSPEKADHARRLGAHHFVDSRDESAMKHLAGKFHLILSTVNVELDGDLYISMLAPKGTLHYVGAGPRHSSTIFPMLAAQKGVRATPLGSPVNTRRMMEFATRHKIRPQVEVLPMSEVNRAFDILRHQRIGHRLVLQNDLN
jgi:uncharacterized zinc-type alcohol dehydrogenase-like protein